MSGLPESGQGRAIYGRYGDARLTAAVAPGMVLAMTRSLADILDVGPSPADAPEEDWALFDELERAVCALTEKLRAEPELSRDAAMLFVKTETNAPGLYFRSLLWPQARKLAGLPAQKRGRPPKL